MSTQRTGHVVGTVQYSAGDGAEETIPLGPCEIDLTSQDAVIGWQDDDVRGTATMPLDRYTTYVTDGCLRLDDDGAAERPR